MDLASSDQWSTGCESGWTVYLDESYNFRSDHVYSHPRSYRLNSTVNDDEDQSMVSDASSGPPQFRQQVDEQCYSRNNNNNSYSTYSEKSVKTNGKRSNKKRDNKKVSCKSEHHQQNQQFNSSNHHLDDTASSPTITYSQMYDNSTAMMGGYSQNMSATHFQGSSSYNNHYGLWQSNNHLNEYDPDQSAQPINYYL